VVSVLRKSLIALLTAASMAVAAPEAASARGGFGGGHGGFGGFHGGIGGFHGGFMEAAFMGTTMVLASGPDLHWGLVSTAPITTATPTTIIPTPGTTTTTPASAISSGIACTRAMAGVTAPYGSASNRRTAGDCRRLSLAKLCAQLNRSYFLNQACIRFQASSAASLR
jgi:hypothetical protein